MGQKQSFLKGSEKTFVNAAFTTFQNKESTLSANMRLMFMDDQMSLFQISGSISLHHGRGEGQETLHDGNKTEFSTALNIFFAFQVAREVMNFTGNVSVSLKPLADGLNFLSDAFFAEISHEKGVTNLFVKVILFMYSI